MKTSSIPRLSAWVGMGGRRIKEVKESQHRTNQNRGASSRPPKHSNASRRHHLPGSPDNLGEKRRYKK